MKTFKIIILFVAILGGVIWIVNKVFSNETCYVCEVCNAEFTIKDELITHKGDEHGNKIRCRICNDKFNTQQELNKHMDTKHMYKCLEPNCNERFSTKAELNEHIVEKHYKTEGDKSSNRDSIKNMPKSPTVYTCHKCKKSFNSKEELNRHIGQKHPVKPTTYKCDRCGKSFTKKSEYDIHESECRLRHWEDRRI